MKKFVLFISLFALSVLSVQARENKLYFTEENNRLYYESKLINEDIFMKHIDMTPGESFTDELIIENGTNTKYTLYFKVVPRNQSAEADELLENIIMKIKLDEEIIYEGKATGLDYTEQGINLQNAILLGDFTPSKNSKMIVETKLSEEYENTNLGELSYIDWSFYGQYENSTPIIINPNTKSDRENHSLWLLFGLVTLTILLIGIVKRNQEN